MIAALTRVHNKNDLSSRMSKLLFFSTMNVNSDLNCPSYPLSTFTAWATEARRLCEKI